VRNGIANARAKGKHIGRVRKRKSALIESLLEAGLSFREIARISLSSHGSVSAQKKEWIARKAAEKKKLEEEQRTKFQEEAAQNSPELDVKNDAANSVAPTTTFDSSIDPAIT
jgi:hypothetical protein